MSNVVVAALYQFACFPDFADYRSGLHTLMLEEQVMGTVLLAREGINGTIAGSRAGVDKVLAHIRADKRFANIESKESFVAVNPFYRCKVKLKKEIVTMGVSAIDPQQFVGTYVEPQQWNALISDPDVLLVDTRNEYEYQIGTFKNAANPHTGSFREFPDYVKDNLDPGKHKKVAMFCTGGIRCEKSTAYLRQQGFEEVYHLKGGILNYLQNIPSEDSMWQGECFVFDNRVTVNHRLEQGDYDQCHACRMPVSKEDMQSEHYQKGVSCPYCYDKNDRTRIKGFAERERQMEYARQRGESHIGQPMQSLMEQRRCEKLRFKDRQRGKIPESE